VLSQRPNDFTLKVRNPSWANGGYMYFTRKWYNDDIEVDFDMPVVLHTPEHWEKDVVYIDTRNRAPGYTNSAGPKEVFHQSEDDCYVAVTRGPLVLAADSRTGKAADSAFEPTRNAELTDAEIVPGESCVVKMAFTPESGESYQLVDYASAGKDWQTLIAAWLPTKG